MAVQDATTLKGYFNTGDTPTEAQFADLIDSSISIDWANPTAVTTTATLTIGTHHVCSGTSADYTVTLPAVSGNAGKLLSIEISAACTKLITVDGNSSETIDGAATRVMWASETAVLLCNGTTWTKIAGKSIPMVGGVYPSAQTTVNNATTTMIQCNTAKFASSVAQINDTANNRIVIPRSAPYAVQFNLQYYNNSATGRYYTELGTDSSGTIIAVNMIAMAATGEYPPIKGTYIAPFAAGSYVYLYAYHNSGSTQTVHNDINNTFLTIQEIPAW
jgi:hypothetical protein